MTKEIYLQLAVSYCIGYASETGVYYIEPMWSDLLKTAAGNSVPEGVKSNDVFRFLDLTVKKLNAQTDHAKAVMNWLYNLIKGSAEPEMVQQENEMIKNMVDYMTMKDKLQERQNEIEDAEKVINQKKDISEILPGMKFSKK